MKKKIFAVTSAILLTVSTTFANDTKPVVPATIVNELQQAFKSATNVNWKATAFFYKASFTVDGHSLEAFFSYDGQLIGVSRKLHIDQLPLSLMKEATLKGTACEITDLFELSSERGTEYFITYGTGKDAKSYKSNGDSWSRFDASTFNYGT